MTTESVGVHELLSRLVIAHELTPDSPRLRPEFFDVYESEWEFLTDYHKQFRTLPNVPTFCAQFPDFPFVQTERTAQWLVDEIEQTYIERQLRSKLIELGDRIDANPREAAKSLFDLAQDFMPYLGVGVGKRIELREDFANRVTDFRAIKDRPGMAGVTLGFGLLDDVTSGTRRGEIEVWFARPGEGKSFCLLHSAIAATAAGHDVTFVSPEMDRLETGIRYDALTLNVSSFAIANGKVSEMAFEEYARLGYDLDADHWGKLYFREAHDHGRFTTADLAQIILIDNPALLVIDGLLLIEPMKNDRDPRKRIINLMEEIKSLVVQTGVPIRLAHQANRQSEITTSRRAKNVTLDEMLPDLHNLAESGAVEQFVNRAIAIKRWQNREYLALRKNRNGPPTRMISALCDIDRGVISDVRIENAYEEIRVKSGGDDDSVAVEQKDELPF